MGSIVVFANGPKDQACARVFEEGPDTRDDGDAEVDHHIVLEQDWADHRNVGEQRDVEFGNGEVWRPFRALTDQG